MIAIIKIAVPTAGPNAAGSLALDAVEVPGPGSAMMSDIVTSIVL